MRAPKKIEEDIQKILDKFQLRRDSPQNFFTTNGVCQRQDKFNAEQQAGNPRKAIKNDHNNNEFKTTVKEFVNKLTTIENEMTILRQDRSELFHRDEELSWIPVHFRAAVKIHNLAKVHTGSNFFTKNLEVLELLNSYILWGN